VSVRTSTTTAVGKAINVNSEKQILDWAVWNRLLAVGSLDKAVEWTYRLVRVDPRELEYLRTTSVVVACYDGPQLHKCLAAALN